jgi:hypothetical protein
VVELAELNLERRLAGIAEMRQALLVALAAELKRPAFPIVISDLQADGFSAAQPRAVQQRQDGQSRAAMAGFFRSSSLAGGEQRPHLVRLQCLPARQRRATHRLQVGRSLKTSAVT